MLKTMPWLTTTILNLLIVLAFYYQFDRSVYEAEGRIGTLEALPTAQRELMHYARQLTPVALTDAERVELTKILIEIGLDGSQ